MTNEKTDIIDFVNDLNQFAEYNIDNTGDLSYDKMAKRISPTKVKIQTWVGDLILDFESKTFTYDPKDEEF